MQQRSGEWFTARMGKVTASRISDVMSKTKSGGYTAGRLNYTVDIICERLTGEVAEHFVSNAMAWGTEQEPYASAEYEIASGNMVEPAGFVEHPSIPMSGASPDGLIGDDGLVEFKCPNTATHIKTLLGESIKTDYMLQMMWQMDCTGRAWCDFVSYDPRLPDNLQLHIERVDRDDDFIKEIREEVIKFLGDADKLEAKLRAKQASSETPGIIITEVSAEQMDAKTDTIPQLKEGEIF